MAMRAVCVIVGQVVGVIFLTQRDPNSPTLITGTVKGLSDGEHGFHVHEFGDVSNSCLSTGAHYNPFGRQHGAPDAPERHAGDLGNIMSNSAGEAVINITDTGVKLYGDNTVIGRAFVVHQKADDMGKGGNEESLKTGNAGARLGCCLIGLANPGTPDHPPLPTPSGSVALAPRGGVFYMTFVVLIMLMLSTF
jgi:Cu-Zn family superoxide dismutase